jgi:hypothetical protein
VFAANIALRVEATLLTLLFLPVRGWSEVSGGAADPWERRRPVLCRGSDTCREGVNGLGGQALAPIAQSPRLTSSITHRVTWRMFSPSMLDHRISQTPGDLSLLLRREHALDEFDIDQWHENSW